MHNKSTMSLFEGGKTDLNNKKRKILKDINNFKKDCEYMLKALKEENMEDIKPNYRKISPVKTKKTQNKNKLKEEIKETLFVDPISFDLFIGQNEEDNENEEDKETIENNLYYTPVRRRLRYPDGTSEIIKVKSNQLKQERRLEIQKWIENGRRMKLTEFQTNYLAKSQHRSFLSNIKLSSTDFSINQTSTNIDGSQLRRLFFSTSEESANATNNNNSSFKVGKILENSSSINHSNNIKYDYTLINKRTEESAYSTKNLYNEIPKRNLTCKTAINAQTKTFNMLFPNTNIKTSSIKRKADVFDLHLAVNKEVYINCDEVHKLHRQYKENSRFGF